MITSKLASKFVLLVAVLPVAFSGCFLLYGLSQRDSPRGVLRAFGNNNKAFVPYSQKIPGTALAVDMVPIQGGTFNMGSETDENGHSKDEGPVHEVTVAPFWMAKFETTWNLYNLFVERQIDRQKTTALIGTEVSIDVDAVAGATPPYVDMSNGMGIDGYPAVNMTQYAASKFCEWLSAMTGNFYRLPTEAEWEYACRAGTKTAYSFGEDATQIDEYAWFIKNSDSTSHKTGLKKPNAWGLHDMHGNVAEWTLDKYNPEAYKVRSGRIKNPFEKPTKTYPKTLRGGSWLDAAKGTRSAARMPSDKKWKMRDPQIPKSKWWHTDAPFIGFRIVRPYNTPDSEVQKIFWK